MGDYGLNKKTSRKIIYLKNIKKANYPIIIFRPLHIFTVKKIIYIERLYFFDKIFNQEPIPIPHSNTKKTQFIHIDDLVRAFENAMKSNIVGKAYILLIRGNNNF